MPGVDVFDPEEALGTDLSVHAAPMITEGFADVARFARLADAALADLTQRTDIPDDGKTGICIALPSGAPLRQLELARLAERGEGPPQPPNSLEADVRIEALQMGLVETIRRFTEVSLHPSPGVTLFEDEAGFGALLRIAARALQGSTISRCLVGGIHSPLDPRTIMALQHAGILLTPENTAGAMPGEAAAFLLVERADSSGEGLTIHGLAQATGIPFVPGEPERPAGVALSTCLAATRAASASSVDLLFTSLNGTAHRAFDWGCAQVRLGADGPFEPETIHPAMSFGDIGAATGPMAVCLADHAYQRGRLPSSTAVVLTSDAGQRASFCIAA